MTGGSRLPFRVRPGAPTSSIDISASGSVGIGTASPAKLVHLNGNNTATMRLQDTSASSNIGELTVTSDFVGIGANRDNTTGTVFNAGKTTASVFLRATNADFAGVVLDHADQQHQPDRADARRQGRQCRHRYIVTGGAAAHDRSVRLAGVANCSGGIQSSASGDLSCIVSSRQFKTIAGDLTPAAAVTNIMAMRPQVGSYNDTPDVKEHWLIAEEVAAIDPALVGMNDGKPYTVKTQNVVADLVAMVQQQQRRIDELERRLTAR